MQLTCAGACVAMSAQIEAAVNSCEEETFKLGQDYYTALAASSPAAAAKRTASASKCPAPAAAKGKPGTDAPTAEVTRLHQLLRHVVNIQQYCIHVVWLPTPKCIAHAFLPCIRQRYK